MARDIMLCFFGIPFSITSNSIGVIERIRFIFRENIVTEPTLKPEVYFNVDIYSNSVSNIDELFAKNIITNNNVNIQYSYDNFEFLPWFHEDTFLPPLQITPLKGRFLVLHGCAVTYQEKSFIFIAPSMSGKTSLTLYLLNRGFNCVTDDLIFIKETRIIPYRKPVGFREATIDILPEMKNIANRVITNETLVFIDNAKKKTWLLHLDDIFGSNVYETQDKIIDYIFIIDKDSSETMRKVNSYEIYSKLLGSICNSGISNKEASNQLFSVLKSSRGYYYLPTQDLAQAYRSILSVNQL